MEKLNIIKDTDLDSLDIYLYGECDKHGKINGRVFCSKEDVIDNWNEMIEEIENKIKKKLKRKMLREKII